MVVSYLDVCAVFIHMLAEMSDVSAAFQLTEAHHKTLLLAGVDNSLNQRARY